MSAAFRCDSEWRAQQNDTTLSQHSAEYLLSELFSQFEKTGAASAVDVEVVGRLLSSVNGEFVNYKGSD